jgi:hypothetical protein
LSNNVFRLPCTPWQYINQRQREKLIRDYIQARDNYMRAVAEARRDYAELVRRGLLPSDDGKSEQ